LQQKLLVRQNNTVVRGLRKTNKKREVNYMEERLAGSQTQTQSTQQVNTGVESGVNENTESVEGVDTSFDFNAWKQEILEEAKLAGQDVQILTRSELDSLIAKALKHVKKT